MDKNIGKYTADFYNIINKPDLSDIRISMYLTTITFSSAYRMFSKIEELY